MTPYDNFTVSMVVRLVGWLAFNETFSASGLHRAKVVSSMLIIRIDRSIIIGLQIICIYNTLLDRYFVAIISYTRERFHQR